MNLFQMIGTNPLEYLFFTAFSIHTGFLAKWYYYQTMTVKFF